MQRANKMNTKKLVFGAIMTALVVVLQLISNVVKFGPFSITLTLIPIVIGAAIQGAGTGAWLGFVMGFIVLVTGGGEPFMTYNPPATIAVVLIKGAMCGYAAGLCYKILKNKNNTLAVFASAVLCPLVNTGLFFLGCCFFFLPDISAKMAGGSNAVTFVLTVLIGFNFLVEFVVNLIFSPTVVRLIQIWNTRK